MIDTHHMYVRKASAGTGKTFTLAAHYIALLLHGEHYHSILAVTFTNKATAEMKQRIVAYLHAIATDISAPSTQGFLLRVREIYAELGYNSADLTNDYCQQEATRWHTDLLIHYDEMRVQTIDSFLQSLLSGMVLQMDGAVGYQVELDTKRIISDAVDDLLTQGAQDPAIRHQLTQYMGERINNEKDWDIRKGLNDIGAELYKEFIQSNRDHIILDEAQLVQFKQHMDWHQYAPIAEFKAAIHHASRWTKSDFSYGETDVVNRVKTLQEHLSDHITDNSKAFQGFSSRLLEGMGISISEDGSVHTEASYKAYHGADNPQSIQSEILQLQQYARQCRYAYIRDKWRTQFINDLILMGALLSRIDDHLAKTNTRLLTTTANTLSQALQTGDADFILEKAGIRYKHIMLDEFQDTSSLQWDNFKKLLTEILSTTDGSTLIVGDIKQSIYRWRNGDWKIMNELPVHWPKSYIEPPSQLIRNRRSYQHVVQFNLETMQHLTQFEDPQIQSLYNEGYAPDGSNLSTYYVTPHHDGGLVQVRCYTQTSDPKKSEIRHQVRGHILLDMLRQIDQLLIARTRPEDIMILVRQKSEAKEVIDAIKAHKDEFEQLTDDSIQSQDCFQLQFSPSVNILVSAIRYIYTDDEPSLMYVQTNAPTFDLTFSRHLLRSMALTDLTEYLIHQCIPSGQVADLSYLNCFRDKIRHYVHSNGSDGIAFIRYWNDKMCEETIPAVNTKSIRMMTIHASKGLEAANVFIPFCDWKMEEDKRGSKLWCEVADLPLGNDQFALLPIPQNNTTAEAGFATEYTLEHHLQRIDNLNLLYVAITRAAQRLYIYADVTPVDRTPRCKWDVGQLMADRCHLWEESLNHLFADKRIGGTEDFSQVVFGDPKWTTGSNSEIVATTIPSQCYSSDSRIEFRQSQDSRKYGWDIAQWSDDQLQLEQAAFGTLCHSIMESIHLYPSLDQAVQAVHLAVDAAYNNGIIPTQELCDTIRPLLLDTVTQLSQWFTGDWHIQCEESVLFTDRDHTVKECRMDRVMWSPDHSHAIVLDYKFGHDSIQYDRQVRDYMSTCLRLGATTVAGYLWIAKEHRLETIHL